MNHDTKETYLWKPKTPVMLFSLSLPAEGFSVKENVTMSTKKTRKDTEPPTNFTNGVFNIVPAWKEIREEMIRKPKTIWGEVLCAKGRISLTRNRSWPLGVVHFPLRLRHTTLIFYLDTTWSHKTAGHANVQVKNVPFVKLWRPCADL